MSLILVIGFVFSPFAALAAFLIVYDEAQHHYPSKREPFRLALEAAVFTLIVFIALSFFIGWFITSFTKL